MRVLETFFFHMQFIENVLLFKMPFFKFFSFHVNDYEKFSNLKEFLLLPADLVFDRLKRSFINNGKIDCHIDTLHFSM